jgi:hypothetical protein
MKTLKIRPNSSTEQIKWLIGIAFIAAALAALIVIPH